MRFKKGIALLCIVALSTQTLPVKAIGAVLFGNQINEEISHSLDVGKDTPCKLLLKEDHFFGVAGNNLFAGTAKEYVQFASLLPYNHAGDVQKPPPNQL
jgi:hypothetical protein